MWLFLFTSGLSILGYILYDLRQKFKMVTDEKLDDSEISYTKRVQREVDDYNLICYRIVFKDEYKSEEIVSDITKEELAKIHDKNEIRFVIIEFMFNGRLCKQIVYDREIQFPIYNFTIQNTEWEYYPEHIWLGTQNITDYVYPYLGPAYNFYMDTEQKHFLKDILYDHPDFKKFDFENDKLHMITNDTPIDGVKLLIKDASNFLIFKRHASVDPRKLGQLGLKLNEYQEIVDSYNKKLI